MFPDLSTKGCVIGYTPLNCNVAPINNIFPTKLSFKTKLSFSWHNFVGSSPSTEDRRILPSCAQRDKDLLPKLSGPLFLKTALISSTENKIWNSTSEPK